MRVRADQLTVGDHLNGCEVLWVLRTPDRRSVVVGLKARRPHRGGFTRVTAQYGADATVTTGQPPKTSGRGLSSAEAATTA
jgi:hypothetical protein